MIKQITPEVTAIHFQNFGSIAYLLQLAISGKRQAVLIDTSSKENKQELISSLKELNLTLEDINTIILTHAHYDHVENINLFPNAKIYGNFTHIINPDHTQKFMKDPKILPISDCPLISSNQQSTVNRPLFYYPAPGHTPGDIIILYKNILFSGDVIFHGGYIGRNDFPESNIKDQQKSLQMLSKLKFNTLCPGH